jgi:hypothetical protein
MKYIEGIGGLRVQAECILFDFLILWQKHSLGFVSCIQLYISNLYLLVRCTVCSPASIASITYTCTSEEEYFCSYNLRGAL